MGSNPVGRTIYFLAVSPSNWRGFLLFASELHPLSVFRVVRSIQLSYGRDRERAETDNSLIQRSSHQDTESQCGLR